MENMLKIGAAARRLGVTLKTLQRWDRCDSFSPLARSLTGLRLYSETQIAEHWPATACGATSDDCVLQGVERRTKA